MSDMPQEQPALPEQRPHAEARIINENEHPIREHQLDREALKVLYRLRDAGFKGYLVGGGVRDLYLGRRPKDFDISTDARPGQLRQLFRNSRTIGRRFRLVQVFFRGNKVIEVSTLRSHSEHDLDEENQILPSNNTFGTLEEDAFRRDLTINALFYEIEQHQIIDYTGGVKDLEQGLIRTVGDPDRRFTRDPVRIMRVVRHAARTGFAIEENTFAALARHKEKLALCPPSRIRDEMLKDLQSGCSKTWAEICLRSSIWQALLPFYTPLLQGRQGQEVQEELFCILSVLDRLHTRSLGMEEPVKTPEAFLFAALILPWATRHFHLPETSLRGSGFQRILHRVREDLEQVLGQPFNIQRMIKDVITTLILNLSTFHHARLQGADPNWLKKKSYYQDCSRFYELYLESRKQGLFQEELFLHKQARLLEQKMTEPLQLEQPRPNLESCAPSPPSSGSSSSGARGRGSAGPAFSSSSHGVFGLRHSRQDS